MSVLEKLARDQSLTPIDYLYRAGMEMKARPGAVLSREDLTELGDLLICAAFDLRAKEASNRELTEELLQERALETRISAQILQHPAMTGGAR